MILQALAQLYEDLAADWRIARPGWVSTKVHWALSIDENGTLLQVIPLLEQTDGKKPRPQQMDLPAPVSRHGKVIKPNFVWDNSAYLLGVDRKKSISETKLYFEECRRFHHTLLHGATSNIAKAICSFFDNWIPEKANNHPALQYDYSKIVQGSNLVFMINGQFAHGDPDIQQAWQQHYDCISNEGNVQQCLVTGKNEPIARTHPFIRGIGEKAESTLVGFNEPAFCSYGKKQGLNAPVGQHAAFAYTAALNYLLADRTQVQKIGDTSVVCWAAGAKPQYQALSLAAIFGQTPPEGMDENTLRSTVRRLADGLPCPELDLEPDRPFYILGLAPNAARLSVRFFYRDTFGKLMKNVNDHHTRMEIVRPSYDRFSTLPLWALLRETVNPNSRDKAASPVLSGAVARAIFSGGLYPAALLENTMLRIRAERNINRGKAAIIKAYYLRNENAQCPKEVLTVSLNENSTNIPYTLGRLFAVYEAAQEAANPGINATIRDKYYNAAASTPGVIFPVLTNLYQKHIRKLAAGSRIWYEKQVSALMSNLGETYPARLTLPEQGAFQLGYYHQTQKRYEKKEEQ